MHHPRFQPPGQSSNLSTGKIFRAHKAVLDSNGSLKIACGSPVVRDILVNCDLHRLVDLNDTMDEADSS